MKFNALSVLPLALSSVSAAVIGERSIGFSDAADANVQSFDNVVDWLNGFRCVSLETPSPKADRGMDS
jgi:hypothetical protein